jgi:hypothetical protein
MASNDEFCQEFSLNTSLFAVQHQILPWLLLIFTIELATRAK